MANVMCRVDESTDRGQLLLVTALALAVMLVTVALLLNTAIFTENVATRDTTVDGSEALELRGELVAAIGELIRIENRQRDGDNATVEAGVDAMGPLVDRERARHGTVATVDRNGTATPGQLLRWEPPDESNRFDVDGDNWTLVDGLGSARAFRLDLDPDSLATTTTATSDSSAIGVRFNRSGDTVTQYIFNESGNLTVAEAVNGGTPTHQCRIEPNGTTTVDLTADRLSTNGSTVDCFRGLWPDDEPEAIEFVNADAAEGTFAVTVDDGANPTSDGDVRTDDAVYSLPVDITYTSRELTFETTVVVAPGEPR